MSRVVLLKTGALGDVLRTTSILPGLARREAPLQLVWVTAPGAVDLVRGHPLVARVIAADPTRADFTPGVLNELGDLPVDRVLSFDDEKPVCELASAIVASTGARVSGAWAEPDGRLVYSADVAPWFDMGLLSVHGRARADELKRLNTRSHAEIHAAMLGLEPGRTRLDLPAADVERARIVAAGLGITPARRWIGLNTGAGGRWTGKRLPEERTAQLAAAIDRARSGEAGFVVLGGQAEAERNRRITALLRAAKVHVVDAGVDHSVLTFAALVDRLDVLVTSDSLALHVAVARQVPVVCFFAPTSAAEIDLWERGTKVVSTAPDVCSYRPDADTSTLTVERLVPPVLHWLDVGRAR
jgi:heptosyltransferase-2